MGGSDGVGEGRAVYCESLPRGEKDALRMGVLRVRDVNGFALSKWGVDEVGVY